MDSSYRTIQKLISESITPALERILLLMNPNEQTQIYRKLKPGKLVRHPKVYGSCVRSGEARRRNASSCET